MCIELILRQEFNFSILSLARDEIELPRREMAEKIEMEMKREREEN
jgi:hypothetical protein